MSIELVIATPLLLLMLLTIMQFALWSHATHIAQAAASQGLATARQQGRTATDGTASAQQMLNRLAHGPLTGTSVACTRNAERASLRMSGTASSVIPFLSLPVHAEAAGPVERFVPDAYVSWPNREDTSATAHGRRQGSGQARHIVHPLSERESA